MAVQVITAVQVEVDTLDHLQVDTLDHLQVDTLDHLQVDTLGLLQADTLEVGLAHRDTIMGHLHHNLCIIQVLLKSLAAVCVQYCKK
ncbi:hypothetical protein D910_03081 [Dendroctonus ponderosae]|uniref:Uncharacterized protein n=1 Tax=Dendroctonus ponderosae TaxID=77166 RepID=U4TVQ2_DENPD|nr:hypothetical protein D910_03081 [Dendroctonus ponderosae]